MVGDGSHIYIYFWHDRWIEDNPLKTLYPGLYECSAMKHGCVSRLGCGCGTRQFLKKVGAGAAGLGD